MINTIGAAPPLRRQYTGGARCYYRQAVFILAALVLVSSFWFASRYPSLLSKAQHIDGLLPSMTYSSVVFTVNPDAPAWQQILATMGNWLNGMKVGMGFGVLLGALLHTVLNYYPLKLGSNLYLNSMKGALVGLPAGVCANCSVPVACGITRGAGRVEAALGFLFSSPNFNPVVVMMTFTALPIAIALTKYAVLLLVIAVAVPLLVRWVERTQNQSAESIADQASCAINLNTPCSQSFSQVVVELGRLYLKHIWGLLRPTAVIMLGASLASSVALIIVPWGELLADVTPLKMAVLSLLATAMPVPIALDVMFAGNLQAQGIPAGYVAMFAMNLGTYSLIPSIYLWREVSRRLSVALFVMFWAIGFGVGMVF